MHRLLNRRTLGLSLTATLALSLTATGQNASDLRAQVRSAAVKHSSGPNNPLVSMGDWSQTAEFIVSRGFSSYDLGTSLAINGETIVIGTYPGGTNTIAFLFLKPAGGWRSMLPSASLSLTTSPFGISPSVSMSGDTIVVGVAGFEGSPGATYVFVKPASGWANMTPTAILTPAVPDSGFGVSTAIDGDTIVVGEADLNSNAGAACVFVKPVGGWANMSPTAVLTASDGQPQDDLGSSVSISGNTIVAGAPQSLESGRDGKAYVFVERPGGWVNMTQTAELTASDAFGLFQVGNSVSISNDTVVVGAPSYGLVQPGEAYVFVKPSTGWINMSQTARLIAADRRRDDGFGESLLITGKMVIVGAPGRTRGPNLVEGGAYVFEEPSTGWKDMASNVVVTAAGPRRLVGLGHGVGLSNKVLVVGALGLDFKGAAYVFERP